MPRLSADKMRKAGYKYRARKYRPKKSSKLTTMVNSSSLRDHTIVADRFKTKMSVSATYTLSAATSGAVEYTIYGNGLVQPLLTANPYTTTFTGTQGSVNTVPPIGFTALSGLYNSYRVLASRIKVCGNPQSTSDPTLLTVIPVQANFAQTSPRFVQDQRYARWRTCTVSNNVKENTIIHYMPSSKALGLTNKQYEDQLPIAVSANPASQLDWYWQVCYATLNGGTNNAVISFQVEVDYYVEFSDPVNLTA